MYRHKYGDLLVMKNCRTTSKGFTLIELMVTLALLAILLAVAVPNLTTFQRNAQLTSFSNTLLASMNAARGEAMKRGRHAMVVPIDGSDWSSGWVVFVDINRSQAYESANDVRILTQEPPPSYLKIKANGTAQESPPYIMFDASGYSKTKASGFPGNQTFRIRRDDTTGTDIFTQTRLMMIAPTGRVRICTPKSSTDAQCLTPPGSGW